jgi:hypothetical protein
MKININKVVELVIVGVIVALAVRQIERKLFKNEI